MLRGALARLVNLAVNHELDGGPAFSALYLLLHFYHPLSIFSSAPLYTLVGIIA
jgi:hypothetical protein